VVVKVVMWDSVVVLELVIRESAVVTQVVMVTAKLSAAAPTCLANPLARGLILPIVDTAVRWSTYNLSL